MAHTTEAITSVPDAPFAEEEPSVNAAADAPDTGVDPNAAPAAGEPDAAQQLARNPKRSSTSSERTPSPL